jgi:hypothetical protein
VVYRPPVTAPAISGKRMPSDFYRDHRFSRPGLHAEPVEAVAVYVVGDGLIQAAWLYSAR